MSRTNQAEYNDTKGELNAFSYSAVQISENNLLSICHVAVKENISHWKMII